MHLPRKLQYECLLRSLDADVEALLLDVDVAERLIQHALESVDPDSEAGPAILVALKEELDGTMELKRWCRVKLAEIAELLVKISLVGRSA